MTYLLFQQCRVLVMLWLKTWSTKGASDHSAFMDKLLAVNNLIHPKDGLSFKEMRMWGQSKILSCCICDWCESREMGGRESQRLPTPMVESFSAGLLPAIKNYWTQSPFKLYLLLGEQDTKFLQIMPFFMYVQQELYYCYYQYYCVYCCGDVSKLLERAPQM